MITLYLAEDQSMLNSALTQLLELEDDLHVVGSAVDGINAWQELQELQPDVAILDIEMPGITGLDVADRLASSQLATKVIVLTTFAQRRYFERAVKANVAGYLLKDSPSDDRPHHLCARASHEYVVSRQQSIDRTGTSSFGRS